MGLTLRAQPDVDSPLQPPWRCAAAGLEVLPVQAPLPSARAWCWGPWGTSTPPVQLFVDKDSKGRYDTLEISQSNPSSLIKGEKVLFYHSQARSRGRGALGAEGRLGPDATLCLSLGESLVTWPSTLGIRSLPVSLFPAAEPRLCCSIQKLRSVNPGLQVRGKEL